MNCGARAKDPHRLVLFVLFQPQVRAYAVGREQQGVAEFDRHALSTT